MKIYPDTAVHLVSVTEDAEALILHCARVSSDQTRTDAGLIGYLVRNGHWSPFEMAHAVLEISTSRAIAAQILRHRSFSFQEFSQRYAAVGQADWLEYPARVKGATNRQSSLETDDEALEDWWSEAQHINTDQSMQLYEQALDRGIATEVARFLLPLSTRTRLYMAGSIRSWIHYFDQRCDEHAQLEHRILAEQARSLLAAELPVLAEALGWPCLPGCAIL